MKKILFTLLLVPAICFAQSQYVAALAMDDERAPTCKVLVSDYHAGAGVMYLGDCGWTGLKGIAAYVQGWNHSNHIRIVRGQFSSGKPEGGTKVTYINRIKGTITTFEEDGFYKSGTKVYKLDNVITDAVQSGVKLDGAIISYVRLANYIDVFE